MKRLQQSHGSDIAVGLIPPDMLNGMLHNDPEAQGAA